MIVRLEERPPTLLVAQAHDRILARGAPGGNDAEDHTHGDGHAEGDDNRQWRDDRVNARGALDDDAEDRTGEDPGDAAGEADHHRFAEKLREHVLLPSADRAPNADLPDALEDRREHDVHDPDAADDERDRRDGAEDDVEDRLRPLLLLEQQLGHGNLEVDDLVVPAGEKPTDNIRHLWNSGGSIHLHDDLVELIVV